MAASMDRVADSAAKIELTIPELKKLAADYHRMAREIARTEKELAAAAEARNVEKRAAAEKALETAVKQEDPIVDGINKFCQSP